MLWSHQESNLDLEFRKLLFYPLNYETVDDIFSYPACKYPVPPPVFQAYFSIRQAAFSGATNTSPIYPIFAA
jgi:hypothetical protein